MIYRPMTIEDYPAASALWQATPGVGLSSADTHEAIQSFLERNPGCSFVAEEDGQLVGTALAGTDGRRGYLYHAAVRPEYRGRGIGTRMVELCLAALKAQGIQKCHLMVMADNASGADFWRALGWELRNDILTMSKRLVE